MNSEFREIKNKLELLKRLDKHLQVYGANKHHYYNYIPDKFEIRDFEKQIGVRLPNTFRSFLQNIGYGAGPREGIWDLARILKGQMYLQTLAQEKEREVSPSKPFPLDDREIAEECAINIAKSIELGNSFSNYLMTDIPCDGCIPLQGISGYWTIFLVTTGEMTGTVWFASEWLDWYPMLTSHSKEKSQLTNSPVLFHHWYVDWLERKLYPKNATFASKNPVIKVDIMIFLLFSSSHSISLTQQGFIFYSIATDVCYDKYTF